MALGAPGSTSRCPGTDAALALAIGHVMVEEGLYDKDFVECWCYGFDEYKERVIDWTPERAAEICWCEPEKIYEAARLIGTAGVTTLQWGVAFDQTKWANGTAHAAVAVQALTGNIDNPGGFMGINFGYVQSDIRENIAKSLPNVREGRLGDDGNWGPTTPWACKTMPSPRLSSTLPRRGCRIR